MLILSVCLILALLAGCASSAPAPAAPQPAPSAAQQSPAASSPGAAQVTPQEPVTLRIVDWSDGTKVQREVFNREFEENHPGVTIEYTTMTIDEFRSSVISLILSGDAPDLFPIPQGMPLSVALNENWYLPISDYLGDDFFDTLHDYNFVEGATMMNGKLYSMTEQLHTSYALLFYNKDILAAAGYSEPPKTYSELIDACKKITENGNGEYYAFVDGGTQLNRIDVLVRAFAGVAGGKISPMAAHVLTNNGRAPFDTPEMIAVFDLFDQIRRDGGIHPDTMTINAPVAREYFAQGQAAFLSQGLWCIGPWAESAPDLNYGVMSIPVPDSGARGGLQHLQTDPWIGIYAQTKHPELAAEYLRCLYSEDYSYQIAAVETGGYLSIVKGINEKYMTNPITKEYYDTARSDARVIPWATQRDELVFDFYTEVTGVEPSLAAIFMGMLSGSVTDYARELTSFADRSTEEWQRAAGASGLDFGVFEFSNWDPTKDYTEQDYAALR